jgi:hypothetical protein
MTRYLRFTSSAELQAFVHLQARHWADWRKLELRRELDPDEFVLGVPDAAKLRPADEQRVVNDPMLGGDVGKCILGNLWRFARPVLRGSAERDAPACWLLLLQGAMPDACDQFVEAAPEGLELLELRVSEEGGRHMFACVVRGEAGCMLAQAPPEGVTAFECDVLPSGGYAALPAGWSAPRMLGELWPTEPDVLVIYWRGPDDAFRVQETEVVNRIPLAQLVEAEPAPIQSLKDLTRDIRPARWRVVRRAFADTEGARDLDSVECWRVVFRVKTFDVGAHPLASGDWRGHELGHAFLQVLDECEAGLLPEILYSAVDVSEAERWHLLYAKRADNRLFDAWSMLDRFDLVPEAAERGLSVFVSASSRMIPPIGAMLSSVASRGEVVDRIKALVGSPAPEALVLIEDLETAGATSTEEWSARTGNPRVIHVDLAKAKPLAELLPSLISDWNNAEPMQALAQSSEALYVRELRHVFEGRLRKIAVDEEDALRGAAERSQRALDEWARQAAGAIALAAAPVREASDICKDLEEALSTGSASFSQACQGLSRFCSELTNPRRAWITEQLRQNAQAVAEAAPRANEADSARNAAETTINQLDGQSATLRRAIEAIEALEPRLAESEREANAVSDDAQRSRDRVLARASAATRRIEQQIADASARLAEVELVRRRILADNERLEVARGQVTQLERDNRQMQKTNEDLAEENRRRAQVAAVRRTEIERFRDEEIPRLESEVTKAETRLAALNPGDVVLRHKKAVAEQTLAQAALGKAEAQLEALKSVEDKTRADWALVNARRSKFEEAKDANRRAQGELEQSVRDLEAAIAELDRQRSSGDVGDLGARCMIARQALEDIRGPFRRRGVLTRVWRAIVGRQS